MENIKEQKEIRWSNWYKFPNPQKGEYLIAPFGFGVYQLRNIKTGEYVLFGRSDNTACRMTSLLPEPYGAGTRKNINKRNYVWQNIDDIEYRTIPCKSREKSICVESQIKEAEKYIFNT